MAVPNICRWATLADRHDLLDCQKSNTSFPSRQIACSGEFAAIRSLRGLIARLAAQFGTFCAARPRPVPMTHDDFEGRLAKYYRHSRPGMF
jgi:hypothetical protein